ncbi:MAG: YbjN domain-containing protein [Deltaproteobacteria bacterium]|nr:YbjN domain-containing protein [Deltaproteobacteria bacterium]
MALFEDGTETAWTIAVKLVERAIADLGLDPVAVRAREDGSPGLWAIQRGSATVVISVVAKGDGREGTLRVLAPILTPPADPAGQSRLFRRLLELNGSELTGAAFGLLGGDVVVVAERSIVDLDASETDALLAVVADVADRYDDELAAQFGAVRISDVG